MCTVASSASCEKNNLCAGQMQFSPEANRHLFADIGNGLLTANPRHHCISYQIKCRLICHWLTSKPWHHCIMGIALQYSSTSIIIRYIIRLWSELLPMPVGRNCRVWRPIHIKQVLSSWSTWSSWSSWASRVSWLTWSKWSWQSNVQDPKEGVRCAVHPVKQSLLQNHSIWLVFTINWNMYIHFLFYLGCTSLNEEKGVHAFSLLYC